VQQLSARSSIVWRSFDFPMCLWNSSRPSGRDFGNTSYCAALRSWVSGGVNMSKARPILRLLAVICILASVVLTTACGGGSSTTTTTNPIPNITSLSPASVTAGAATQTLTINGTNFLSGSTATYNGVAHPATFVSSTQLSISLSTSDQATAGSYPVVVTNPSPGGGPSNAVTFTVNNPVPTVTSLSPSSVTAGAGAETLTINGTNFLSGSTVTYDRVAHAATFVSSTQLTISLSTSDQATAGSYPVVVTNPSPGGGPSNAVNFTVSIPLQIVQTNPPDGATNVTTNTNVVVTFSTAIDPSSVDTASFFVVNNATTVAVPGVIRMGSGNITATFVPSQPLAFGHSFFVTLTTAIKDPAGSHLPGNANFGFITGPVSYEADSLEFSVLNGTPPPGAVGATSREADGLAFSLLNGTPPPGAVGATSREADGLTFSLLNGVPPVPAQPAVFEVDSLTFSVQNTAPPSGSPMRRAGLRLGNVSEPTKGSTLDIPNAGLALAPTKADPRTRPELGESVSLATAEQERERNSRFGDHNNMGEGVRTWPVSPFLNVMRTAFNLSIGRIRIPIRKALRITARQGHDQTRPAAIVAAADSAVSGAGLGSQYGSKRGEAALWSKSNLGLQ